MRGLLVLMLLGSTLATCQQAQIQNPIVHVATALNHLTVLEFQEPVTMAAAGSSDFQIERESNRVFVKPVKSGAATDLFVWTQSRRFAYELETTEELKNMNFAIDNAPLETPKSAQSIDTDQLADVILTRALLGAEEITRPHSKTPKNHVSVRVEQVFRSRSTVYIQYTVSNNTKHLYHLTSPQVSELRPGSSDVSLTGLVRREVDGSTLDKIGYARTLALPVAHSESESEEIQPGTTTPGVVAIRQNLQSPALVQLTFGDGLKVTVVL